MKRTWFIYALKDPRTDSIRYVGWAFDVKRRFQAHLLRAKLDRTHKDCWLRKLAGEGITPSLEVLETGAGDGWALAERAWIFKLRAIGHDLTNTSDGGSGGFSGGVHSLEAREKIAAASRGRMMSAETLAKLVASLKASSTRAAHMAKLAEHNRGKPRSAETRAKVSAGNKGKKLSAETVAKIVAARRLQKLSPEHIAALAAGRDNPETRAKIAAGNRGRLVSPETRAKIGAARRAAWIRDGGRARKRGGEVSE